MVGTIAAESKALRLARYLREFVGLRSTTIYEVGKYESVLWFGDMPQESECRSPAWRDDFDPNDPWLEVHKQQPPKFPEPPDIILPWIDQEVFRRASGQLPALHSSRLIPDTAADVGHDEEMTTIDNSGREVIGRRMRGNG